jgi:hypothetical protein
MVSRASLLVTIGVSAVAVGGIAVAVSVGLLPGGIVGGGLDNASVNNGSAQIDLNKTNASFTYRIDKIEACGLTCRNATGTITNDGDEAATGITIETRIIVDNTVLWQGTSDVDRLEPDESYTDNKRVELTFAEGQAVRSNDGEVTVETIVRFDQGTDVFSEVKSVS